MGGVVWIDIDMPPWLSSGVLVVGRNGTRELKDLLEVFIGNVGYSWL